MDSQDHGMDSQDHDMYFTNLLSQDPQFSQTYGRQSEIPSLDDSPPLSSNNPPSVKKSVRGVNFSLEEDKLLVSAWLNCSLDAVQGTDQKHSQFWEKIFEYFNKYKETTIERTVKSLEHRWSVIQKATNKFCAKLAQVEGLNQSGTTKEDKLEKAKMMYHTLEKCNFQFEHCWQLLKDQPKWVSRTTKDTVKQKKVMISSASRCSVPIDDSVLDLETGNVIKNDVMELDRPMGRKAEKGKRKAQGRQAEEVIQLRKMKYTLLEESRAQEKDFYRLKAEKMEYDKKKEQDKIRQEDQRLKLEAEKMEYNKEKKQDKIHQENERLKLEAEKMEYNKEKKQDKIRQEDEKLRLEAEKLEFARKESDRQVMMMDVSVMPEMKRLYFEELQGEIMMRRRHARDNQL